MLYGVFSACQLKILLLPPTHPPFLRLLKAFRYCLLQQNLPKLTYLKDSFDMLYGMCSGCQLKLFLLPPTHLLFEIPEGFQILFASAKSSQTYLPERPIWCYMGCFLRVSWKFYYYQQPTPLFWDYLRVCPKKGSYNSYKRQHPCWKKAFFIKSVLKCRVDYTSNSLWGSVQLPQRSNEEFLHKWQL